MKNWFVLILFAMLAGCATTQPAAVSAEAPRRLHHLVVIWLKQPGDEGLRQQYIEANRGLAQLPGVVAYDVGTPAVIQRQRANAAVDESYDVAISAVFENQEAFEAFLKHPDYVRTAQQVLRPLVNKYSVYDFIEH